MLSQQITCPLSRTSKLIVAASSLPNMADIREEARMAACLYITCRQTGNPQAFKVITIR